MVLDGYIRVSQVRGREGESFISPKLQREEIARWASAHGAYVGRVFEELDEVGDRRDRPLLMEAVGRVEDHSSNGIVVPKLNRFGRSLVDGIDLIARIQAAGGTLVSVQQGFDLRTHTGQFIMRIFLAMAEWELDQTRENWDIARSRAIARGVYIGKIGPIGYIRKKDGRLRIDPRKAPAIREVFERRSRGQGLEEIAVHLNETGVESQTGVPFTTSAVSRILANPAYRGEAYSGTHSNPDAHEPIVDAALWQRCQSVPRPSRQHVEALLPGAVRCASCGALMIALRPAEGRRFPHTYYRCHAKTGTCPGPAQAEAAELEPLVEEFVFRLPPVPPAGGDEPAKRKSEEAVKLAEEDLASYRDSPGLLLRLGEQSFEIGVERRQQVLERKLLELSREQRAVQSPQVNVVNLKHDWDGLDWKMRSRAVKELIDCVIVERGAAPLRERARIFKRGRGPIVTVAGAAPEAASALERKANLLPTHRRWTEQRIERELRAFLGERSVWPDYLQFASAGRARLHAQVCIWGGAYYWAHRLGLEVPKGMIRWTDEKVRASLGPFLRGRREWPTKDEFEEAGLSELRVAVFNHGGVGHWAEHFGLAHKSHASTLWTKELTERELRRVVGEGSDLPTKTELIAAGESKLNSALSAHGGRDFWAKRLGLRITMGRIDRE